MSKRKKTKLSIYLIKEDRSEAADILREGYEFVPLNEDSTLFYWPSAKHPPSWVSNFLGNTLDPQTAVKIFGASARAVVLVNVKVKQKEQRLFALAFGHGWQYLSKDAYEERFGLLCALNAVDPDQLRKFQSKNISSVPRDISEQLSRVGSADAFGIDPEQSLVVSVCGISTQPDVFGKLTMGRDAFSATASCNINEIQDYLKRCYELSRKTTYKDRFDWIDHIAEVKSPGIRNKLDKEMINNIQTGSLGMTWMAVPDIVTWEEVSGFRYAKDGNLFDDICLQDFLESLPDEQRNAISVETLKKRSVMCIKADEMEEYDHWSAYNCMYCEVHNKESVYMLSAGKWYKILGDYVTEINAKYIKFRDAGSQVTLPPMAYDVKTKRFEKEDVYNNRAAKTENNWVCLDCDTINHGGKYSKVEFCDIYQYDERRFVHVKKYGASAVLSHLFAQGLVAAELFLEDKGFRDKLNKKLPAALKFGDTSRQPAANQYEVVYAIASKDSNALELPFFSKVSLCAAIKQIGRLGYRISLSKIEAQPVVAGH